MCRSNNTFELTWAKPVQDIPSPHVNPLFVGGATVSPMASSPAALGAAASMAQAAAMAAAATAATGGDCDMDGDVGEPYGLTEANVRAMLASKMAQMRENIQGKEFMKSFNVSIGSTYRVGWKGSGVTSAAYS